MQFPKLNFFKKFNETMPIGLCALGLKRKNKKSAKNNGKKIVPNFFRFGKVTPVAN